MFVSTIWFTNFEQFLGFLIVFSVFYYYYYYYYFREDECKLGVNRQQGIYDNGTATSF